MYLKYQTLKYQQNNVISGIYGIICDNTDAIIANNCNDGANFCNTVSNSNITIENNKYINNLVDTEHIYIINSLFNNTVYTDKNKINDINNFVKNNISFTKNKYNSLINIFQNNRLNHSIFDASINTGFSINSNTNSDIIWSAKFANDGGCAFGYHWSDIGICISSAKIKLNDFPAAFVTMNNQQFIYANGKHLTLILTKPLDTPIILNNFKNGKFTINTTQTTAFNIISDTIYIDTLKNKDYKKQYYLFDRDKLDNQIDTLFIGISNDTYQLQLINLNEIQLSPTIKNKINSIDNKFLFTSNNVNSFIIHDNNIFVNPNKSNSINIQNEQFDLNFLQFFYLGQSDSNLIKYSNSKTIYNVGIQLFQNQQETLPATYKITYIEGTFSYLKTQLNEETGEEITYKIYNDSDYILNKLSEYVFADTYLYIDLPGLIPGGFKTEVEALNYAKANNFKVINIDTDIFSVLLNANFNILGNIKFKLEKYLGQSKLIIQNPIVNNTNFIYTNNLGDKNHNLSHYPLILTGTVIQYNGKQISGTFTQSFNTAIASGILSTDLDYDNTLYQFNLNNRHTYKLSIPTFNSEKTDVLEGVLFNHTHKNLLFNPDSNNNLVTYTNYPKNPQQLGPNKIDAQYLSKTVYGINIPILQSLPIGCIIPLFQIYSGNKWFPEIPYGFYQLTKQWQEIPIISNDAGNKYFNLPLAYLMLRSTNNLNLANVYSFKLPALQPIVEKPSIYSKVSKFRIVYMIKYNFNIFEKN